jgi:hypothetical protein
MPEACITIWFNIGPHSEYAYGALSGYYCTRVLLGLVGMVLWQ